MKNNQEISKLNYNAIGIGILEETIGFNQDLYEFVDVETYSDETIFNMAKEFIENHAEETIDYLKWCFALIDDCDGKTYDVMFDIVAKYTEIENDSYYWNNYIQKYVPSEFLNNACDALENELPMFVNYKFENDLDCVNGYGALISLIINNTKYEIFNDNEKYIFRDVDSDLCYPKDTTELIDVLYKLTNIELYNKRIVKRYLKNYKQVGEDVLYNEVAEGSNGDSIYWINISSLAPETIEIIGKEFVDSNPEEAEKFAEYILGIGNEYPTIYNIVEDTIKENVLKLEKDNYYWDSKFSQVTPRAILLDLEKFLSLNGISFTHNVDDGEYIEVGIENYGIIEIHGLNYNDIVGESSDYCMVIDGVSKYVKENEILMHIEQLNNSFSSNVKYTLENATYINYENNWLLQETKIFDDENDGVMINTHLQVLDMTNNMAVVDDEILNDDVWSVDWVKINSFTKKINQF